MLNENIKTLRKNKGIIQEELASRLHVVRQTVSKWEKGYSVPDAETLQQMASIFDTNVSQLLGTSIHQHENVDIVAEQLSRINEQLVVKNNRNRKIWKMIGIFISIMVIGQLLLVALGVIAFDAYEFHSDSYVEEVQVLD